MLSSTRHTLSGLKQRWLRTCCVPFRGESILDVFMSSAFPPLLTAAIAFGLSGAPVVALAQTVQPTDARPPADNQAPIATSTASRALSLSGLGTNQATPDTPDSTLLEADTIERGETDDIIIATGNVTSRAQGRQIRADKIIYNQRTGIINAIGNVTVINPDGSSSFADQLTLDDELATGVAGNFTARLTGGAVLASTAAVRREGVGNLLSNVIYTACQICKDGKTKPTWLIRARRANQNERTETINYNDVVFEMKGVPLLYIPYFQHADPSVGRRSGLLQPKPGQSSRFGYFWEQPYLQVLDASSDITITPLVAQYINPLIQAQYRRSFYSGSLNLEGSVTREKFFGKRGEKFGDLEWRSHLFARAKFDINETWNWGFGAETASDDLYLFRYRIASDGQPRGLIRPQTSRLMSEIFVQGQSENFYVRSIAASFQDLIGAPGDPNGRRKNVPKVAPLFDVNYRLNWGPMNGRLDLTGSTVALNRTTGRLDSVRASLGAQWRGSHVLPSGIVIEPLAYARADYFNYSREERGAQGLLATPRPADSFARGVGLVSVQASWPLQRAGTRFNATLEPLVNFTLATDASEQDRVRVEDGLGFELDATSVLRPAGPSGYDQWEGGSRVSLGIKAGVDLIESPSAAPSRGPVRANIFLGRRFRSDSDSRFARASNLDRQNSDWVSELDVTYRDIASFGGRLRFDGETGRLLHGEAVARLKLWRTETDLRYHDFALEAAGPNRVNSEIQGTTRLTLNKNFKLFASINRNITDRVNLYEAFGVIYGDECTDLRLFFERTGTRNRFLEPANSIRFQIAFRTLGVLSDAPFD
jgi:LPS-assembly protein